MSTLAWIVGFTLLGGVAGVMVASLFLLVPERVRSRALPLLVAFATGALLAAALLGLLPEAVELAGPAGYGAIGAALLGGIALFFILEKLVLWRHCHEDHCETHSLQGHGHGHGHDHGHHERAPGVMLLVGETMHNVLDGVLIAAAFLINLNLGVMTGLAVLAHEVPSEVGNFAVLLNSGLSRRQALRWNLTAALGAVAGGVVGYLALSALRPILPYALAVSAASLLYVAVADLIPGLHRRVDARSGAWQVLLIGAGIALVGSVEYLLPH